MKLTHLITAGMVVLALGACSKKENATTSMEGSQPATESSTGAMETPKEPAATPAPATGETTEQSGQPAPMQEPAGSEEKTQ